MELNANRHYDALRRGSNSFNSIIRFRLSFLSTFELVVLKRDAAERSLSDFAPQRIALRTEFVGELPRATGDATASWVLE